MTTPITSTGVKISDSHQPQSLNVQAQRMQLNAQIVSASAEFKSDTAGQPQALLFRSAIEKLNELLLPELGENAVQQAADSGIDFSPEATAERIVGFATGFLPAFLDTHANEDPQAALDEFMQIIRDAIEQGFSEAREILDGLSVLEGDIAANIDTTFELVLEGLERFEIEMAPEDL
ncbi:MAG: DUF5610 domain-containing protein [gamma proteobacterium endosymbiont of Lamellibrachia anaximandri]|nr:DUF5610 domain-containing protein [gamma proteobacterium endosymbiont of Lamellibrachia anaximandri]MBL3619002.1 DUF5610 domain-containing protein [gamma proteobacterium endosymbiont of Lamellibrachia anaximandri]